MEQQGLAGSRGVPLVRQRLCMQVLPHLPQHDAHAATKEVDVGRQT